MRSLTSSKTTLLKAALGNLAAQLELVVADLEDAGQIKAALADSTYVVHTASPVGGNRMVETAVNGTLNVLKACHEH